MADNTMEKKLRITSFSKNYWIVIMMEFFERGSYYGMMSILSVYMTDQLAFSKESVGVIKSTIQPLLYILPILSGAIGERFGYRKTLTFAFIFLGLGYFLTSQTTEYAMVFASLIIMAFGAGAFKPMISGTIARETNESNSTLGFGIFYWSINLGAFLFPLILVPYIKNNFGWQYVMLASAIGTASMLIPTYLVYKEPKKPENTKTIAQVLKGAVMVLTDVRFIGLIVIYSGFWILYFQMFDSVLWYVQKYVDASSLDNFVNGVFSSVGINLNWKFDVEHVTVINAGTIILLQIFVSNIVKHTKALPTMIAGIAMGTIGMAILAINTNIWVFILGIVIFSIGEMTAHPKFISYVGLIAPEDKKALYLGYAFLYGVLGSLIGGILGANLYVYFVDTLNEPSTLWIIFSMIGVVTIIGLILYNKFLAPKKY
ncbi:MAG: MFS transporter [Ignavibacteriaceae bacterium]|nr:MFS transporter [Ignavibacteriaceae bacterium]MCW8812465.1 MFS transporter [Chlorobium sp.]MCW8823303.1 MFS transporter [Ignavibacteriaceae bacterium]MCW8961533.1 MFS transporter [Ignavibacteriaceae bacterium]MCW9097110.1 MFS transporter [Ignavibacteriaceae bacterium]